MLLLVGPAARGEAPGQASLPERLTLDEAVRLAQANHPQVGAARRSREAAAARVRLGYAPFAPSLTGSIAYSPRTTNPTLDPQLQRSVQSTATTSTVSIGVTCRPGEAGCTSPMPCVRTVDPSTGMGTPGCVATSTGTATTRDLSFDMTNFWSMSFGIQWTLWDWGRVYYNWQAALENERAAGESTSAAMLQVAYDTRVAFYNQLQAEQLVAVAQQSVATQERHARQMEGFVTAGTRTRVDLAQSQADLASAQLVLTRAQGQLGAARIGLLASLGVDEWHDVALVPPEDEAGADAQAELRRPEIRQLEAQARAQDDIGKAARAGYLPQLSLSLGPNFQGSSLAALTPNFQIGVVLSYAGGFNPITVSAQRREAEANAAALREQERGLRLGYRLEIGQADIGVQTAREALAVARKLVAAAKERRDLADARFTSGVGTVLELSDAESAYVTAQAQVIQAQVDLGLARSRLLRAVGGP